ncbi:hypothetical protein PITC_059010 [Penicillium italicum]|uniref:Uncharacterized protein n=1 Tax=Penicillium italicum TaxID=40296 RepID=A0A0A2LGG9_PENIT|nr:hypothetical protein PITC_059010 [Penicillium italicum]
MGLMFERIAKMSALVPTLHRVDGLVNCLRGHLSRHLVR